MREIVVNGRFLTQAITGVQRYAHELTRAIDAILDERRDLSVEIVCPRLAGPPPVYRNIRVVETGRRQGHAWEQIDLPLASRGRPLFCPGNTAPIAALIGRQRVVVCVHDLSYLYFPNAYSRSFKLVYNVLTPLIMRRATAVITVSQSERRAIVERYPMVEQRITAIQNGGLAATATIPATDGAEDRDHVLYVGSLSRRKNFPAMLKVAEDLARRRGTRFVFVGGTAGSLEASDRSAVADLADRIEFAGQVDDTQRLIDYYRRAAVFMFPSLYEASPLPPIEAMACGCPVVAGAIPSLEERCGDAALYCDPNDPADIAAKIERLLDDPAERRSLAERGRRQAERFSWRNCARATLEVLEA